MKYRLLILKSAENDIVFLKLNLLKAFSMDAWLIAYAQLKADFYKLQKYPKLGFILEEAKRLGLNQFRQIDSGRYQVIYELSQDALIVHTVCDKRHNLESLLANRQLCVLFGTQTIN